MKEELPKKKRGKKKKVVEPAQIMPGFVPSKYQQDVFDFIQHGNGNAVIKALAGAGKTATIVNAIKLIPPTCNALFIAFNKEIVKELEKKLEGIKNVQVKTLHSLGYLMIRRNLGTNIEIDEYKYRTFIKKNIKQLSSTDFNKMTTKLIQQYIDNVIQLCDLGRYNLAQCEKDLLRVAVRHDVPIIDDECNTVLNVMKWGRENTTSIDFTDMVWLPYELTLNPIGLQYDYIFIDECFPYEQRISTTYGKLKIGDLYNRFINNKPLPLVKSFNEKTQKFEDKKILNVFNKGERDLIEIIVGRKRKIRCTPNERFLTLNGYQYISKLTVGDYILSSTKHQPYHGFLNTDQLDLFKASVIGDGSLNKLSNGVFRCKFIHGEKQKEYIEWKCNMFNQDVSEIRRIKKNGFSEKNAYTFSTLGYCISNNDLDKKEIINNLTIKQLAINYQDNGIYDKNGTMRLYSCVHNEELIDLLVKRIKSFGIECVSKHLFKSSTSNKEYFYISIGVKDSYKLSEMFAPYINKCLQYKIHDDFKHLVNTYKWDNTSSELGGMPITSMKMLSKKEIVYDIEVEDNHNFIITNGSWSTKCETNNEGFIVHNCQDLNAAQRELFLRCFRRGTRFIAVGDKKQCQPAGTKVLMYDGSEKNIEDIKIGDKVVTYLSKSKCCFKGYKNHSKTGKLLDKYNDTVLNIANRIVNKTIKIKTSNGFTSEYSYEHLCYAKFNRKACENTYALYLMGNDEGMFRIGETKLFNNNSLKSFGIKACMRSEGCNKAWLLNIYDNEKKAKMDEIYYSTLFGIPQVIFKQQRTGKFFINDNDVIELYEKIGDMSDRVLKCLSHFNKLFDYPFCINGNTDKHSKEYISTFSACNLFPKYMDVIIFDANNVYNRTHGQSKKVNKIIKGLYDNIEDVQYLNVEKVVYSLDVSNNHNYVADGILTHNCIYSFAGADSESFVKLQNLPNTTTLPLPISYRCPKKVVNLANQFVDTMECREGAPDGEIVHNVSIKDIHDGDMVLCRTKMPLIKLYMRYLRMGVKSYVRGQDIGLNLLRMVDKTEQIMLNVSLQKDGVFARLYDDLFEERNRLMIKRGMDLEDATLSNQIMSKYDSIKALEILAEGLTSARDLHDRIENVFAESADGVCLSTIHKAKGLEANNVYILCKTLMPSKLATQDWEKEQEQNLMYVAYTRAKYKLGFVSETEISPSAGMIDPSAALTELNYIENKICKLLNKTPQVIMDATEVAQYNLKSATIIEEKETNHVEISSKNNEESDNETMKRLLELIKKKGGIEKFEKFLEQ